MDIGIVVKLASDLIADEPAIVADIAAIEGALAKMRALPPITDAESFVAIAKVAVDTLETVAPLIDQIIAQVKALGIAPAAAPSAPGGA